MPTRFLRQIHRERRRLALVAALLLLAARLAGEVGAPALPFAGRLGSVSVATGLLALWTFAVPRWRVLAETAALASLVYAGFSRGWPGSVFAPHAGTSDWLLALLAWAGIAGIAWVALNGGGAAPWPVLRKVRLKARAGSRIDIHRLWYGLVPTPERAEHYADPQVVAIDYAGPDGTTVHLVHVAPGEPRHETQRRILDLEAPFRIRYRELAPLAGPRTPAKAASVEFFLVDLGRRRLLLLAEEFSEIPLGQLVTAWLDDAPGRALDAQLAAVEARGVTGVPPKGSTARITPEEAWLDQGWLDDASDPADRDDADESLRAGGPGCDRR